MENPFETINHRLSKIESLLLEIQSSPDSEEEPKTLTVKETAEYLKVSTQSIHNYIKKGILPATKVGRLLLIKRIDLEEAMKEVKSLKYRRV